MRVLRVRLDVLVRPDVRSDGQVYQAICLSLFVTMRNRHLPQICIRCLLMSFRYVENMTGGNNQLCKIMCMCV